jgi:hypothetical protein
MRYKQLAQPAAIPSTVMSFDPEAGDCTCVNPIAQYQPAESIARDLRGGLHSPAEACSRVNVVSTESA